jgi:hypothetical protein
VLALALVGLVAQEALQGQTAERAAELQVALVGVPLAGQGAASNHPLPRSAGREAGR